MKLIHKNEAVGVADDPYDFDEKDPYKCNALESSLWEVQTLAEHYYANVSTLAKIFSDKFLKPRYEIEDFLDHTYSTVSAFDMKILSVAHSSCLVLQKRDGAETEEGSPCRI